MPLTSWPHRQPPRKPICRPVLICGLCIILLGGSGCSSSAYLPSARETVQSPWQDFNDVKASFDQIIPYQTNAQELKAMGFDPFTTPNMQMINYLDITQRFMPNQSIKKEDLDQGLQHCLNERDRCHAYEVNLRQMKQDRYGNVFFDLFNFRRKNKLTGWEFKAIIVMQDDLVVYKLWSGKPKIDENRDHKNPFGPLQSSEQLLWHVVE